MSHSIPDTRSDSFYDDDPMLQSILERHLDSSSADWARPRLQRMGRLAASEVDALAFDADANPPVLDLYDRQGERTEGIRFHPSYGRLKELSYGEGIVADYYDPEVRRVLGDRLHRVKFALGFLFAQSEQGLYCPICMTDGAARLIEKFGSSDLKERHLKPLTQRPPDFWQGAMFLTEKQGGSDVGANTTSARDGGDGAWRLTGDKWFCSNAEADVAMVLARPEGGREGTRGLGLFSMARRLDDGGLNPWYINRLKNKLGTRSMPTGEGRLEGATAYLIGEPDRGFSYMAEMLNLSRLYNAVASIAIVRRATREAANYAAERQAFGRRLDSFPMVQETLLDMALELEGAVALVFETVATLDRYDAGDGEVRPLLRFLTPLGKLFTARLAVRMASEAVELLAGNGYVEDRITARLYRDAQVLPVWEGTTNILVLDCFRALKKEGSLEAVEKDLRGRLQRAPQDLSRDLEHAVSGLLSEARDLIGQEGEGWTLGARTWCSRSARVYESILLAEAAASSERNRTAADGFISRFLSAGIPPHRSANDVAERYRVLLKTC